MGVLTQFCAWALYKQLCHTAAVWAVTSIYLPGSGLQSDAHVVWVQESKLVLFFGFFLKRWLAVNLFKWWMLDAEMVPLFVNLVLEWVDPFKEWLFYLVWGETFVLFIGKYGINTQVSCISGGGFLRDCVQECKSWSGMVFSWWGKPMKRYRGSSDSPVMKQKCVSDCEYNLCPFLSFCSCILLLACSFFKLSSSYSDHHSQMYLWSVIFLIQSSLILHFLPPQLPNVHLFSSFYFYSRDFEKVNFLPETHVKSYRTSTFKIEY